MEATLGGEASRIYGVGAAGMWGVGKRNVEWDLNDWKWDGDLFLASSSKPGPSGNASRQLFPPRIGANSSNSSSSCSDEANVGIGNGRNDVERKRRVIVIEDDTLNDEAAGSLSLKLGGYRHANNGKDAANWEENSGKKTKVVGGGSTSRAVCQVQNCGADLSNAKDYHRRHKVCEMHSKATKALLGNVMQRFCQQCSRFHTLQEFDEGKRSCRRRLAGHNKRRRKTNPEPASNGNTVTDDQTSSYLLISLLKIISNMHATKSDQGTDQDLLSHLLSSLASQAVGNGVRNLSALLPEPCTLPKDGALLENSEKVAHVPDATISNIQTTSSAKPIIASSYPMLPEVRDNNAGHSKINNFNLNDEYVDSDDGSDDADRSPVIKNVCTTSPDWIQQDSHQSSPPQTSGNSDSASAQSPSSSSGDAQSRTDRIVFKLFGKEPNDFPFVLRAQILDWLSHSPTDIESYIRPGCIVLTIYLRLSEAAWEELCYDLGSSLARLLDVSEDAFWQTGWLYIRAQDQIAFIYNGKVVIDRYLPPSNSYSKILSIKPIAISASERARFVVKGVNLSRSATRLLCAIEGQYMVREEANELTEEVEEFQGHDGFQSVIFSCSIPAVSGRGFIEIEDNGLSSSFFPFIVAEEDVCSEVRMLEAALDSNTNDDDEAESAEVKDQATNFIHEMGWLLHRSQVKNRLGHLDPNTELFTFRRFKWLMEFSMDREWCAVVRKLLNILLNGLVGTGEHSSIDLALSEMGLLHRAVRRNSMSLAVFLLRYIPETPGLQNKELASGSHNTFLFRPNISGPGGLTPLHIAAGKDGSEDILDALTDDPGMVGTEAWKNARDSTGFTPEDYARLRGHYSYIHLVQKKINKRSSTGHVVVDIPTVLTDAKNINQKENKRMISGLEIGRPGRSSCKLCSTKSAYGTATSRSMYYRPAMLSLVGIAAVCVCVALLFKSSPEVVYVFRPFRWETLEYGAS